MSKDFPERFASGTVVICGSAPSLLDEYEKVMDNRPDAKVMAINEAVSGVWADYLISYHAEKFDYFKGISLNPNITSHTAKGYREELEEAQIDYRWEGIKLGATSAGDAIQIAKQMGFTEIILVGCPMNGGDGYFNNTSLQSDGCPRFGAPLADSNRDMVTNHKKGLMDLKQSSDFNMVWSMSGYSAEVFGKWRA